MKSSYLIACDTTLMKMFNLLGIGEIAGSGILKQAKKTSEENKRRKTEENYVAIKKYLKQHGLSKNTDIAVAIELSPARTRVLLKEIAGVNYEGTNTNRRYYLLEE